MTAFATDFFDIVGRFTPIVFVFVLGLSFVLLTLVFRSIVIPAKAILMNLLSVGAAYGLLVLVFQEGVGADLLGFQQTDKIEAWLPLFLFSILFGLSMDYHVFLLSRIRERFDQTHDNNEAVAYGLRSTAGLITGAGLIMVAVFSGFAAGRLPGSQQIGFGLATAIFLDATIVRVDRQRKWDTLEGLRTREFEGGVSSRTEGRVPKERSRRVPVTSRQSRGLRGADRADQVLRQTSQSSYPA